MVTVGRKQRNAAVNHFTGLQDLKRSSFDSGCESCFTRSRNNKTRIRKVVGVGGGGGGGGGGGVEVVTVVVAVQWQ